MCGMHTTEKQLCMKETNLYVQERLTKYIRRRSMKFAYFGECKTNRHSQKCNNSLRMFNLHLFLCNEAHVEKPYICRE